MSSPLKYFAVAAGTALVGLLPMIGCGGEQSPLAQVVSATVGPGGDTGRTGILALLAAVR